MKISTSMLKALPIMMLIIVLNLYAFGAIKFSLPNSDSNQINQDFLGLAGDITVIHADPNQSSLLAQPLDQNYHQFIIQASNYNYLNNNNQLSLALAQIKSDDLALKMQLAGPMPLVLHAIKNQQYVVAQNILAASELDNDFDSLISPIVATWLDALTSDNPENAIIEFLESGDSFLTLQAALISDAYNFAETGELYHIAKELNTDSELVVRLVNNYELRQKQPETPRVITSPSVAIAEVYNDVAASLIEYQAFSQSEQMLAYASLLDANNDFTILLKALLALNQGQSQAAIDLASAISKDNGYYAQGQLIAIKAHLMLNQPQTAVITFKNLQQFDDTSNLLNNTYTMAEYLSDHNEPQLLLQLLAESPEALKQHWLYDYYQGLAHRHMGQSDRAYQALTKAYQANKDEPQLMLELGLEQLHRDNVIAAAPLIEAAFITNQHEPRFQAALGVLRMHQDNPDKGVDLLLSALTQQPEHIEINDYLGNYYHQQENYLMAAKYWNAAIQSLESNGVSRFESKTHQQLKTKLSLISENKS